MIKFEGKTELFVSHKEAEKIFAVLKAKDAEYPSIAERNAAIPEPFEIPGYMSFPNLCYVSHVKVEPYDQRPAILDKKSQADLLADNLIEPNRPSVKISFYYALAVGV